MPDDEKFAIATGVRSHFDRIAEETRKAACYLAASRAIYRVPNFARRWADSDLTEAVHYARDGMHMAFVTTLAATYQVKKGMVTIPSVIKDLNERTVRYALAKARGVDQSVVAAEADRANRTYARILKLPIHRSLKDLRDNVVAHHAKDDGQIYATQGPLNRLMIRTVVLVDRMGMAINGETTPTAALAREVLQQATVLLSHGIDADRFGDLPEGSIEE
jgi:hypothetical protein